MVNLKLETDEGIIEQTADVERYRANDDYEEIEELYLTNKSLIYIYEKSNGLFSKSEDIIEKTMLGDIKVVDGKVQIFKIDDSNYGLGLQILRKDGSREHLVFEKKKELQIWYNAIIETITGEKIIETNNAKYSIPNIETNSAIMFSNLKNIVDSTKGKINNIKKQVVDELLEEKQTNKNNIESQQNIKEKFNTKEILNKKDIYCSHCGKILSSNSKFCSYCGTAIGNIKIEDNNSKKNEEKIENKEDEASERKSIYEGKIHKCPNCGEILNSFVTNCPTCGYELRNLKNSSAVEELSRKLEEIEHNRDKTNVSTKILSVFNLSDGLTKTDEQKISLIRNFPIPNTKEDLYEFLILSKSNIEIDLYENTQIKSSRLAISNAWKAKFEQAYQKAKLLLKDDTRILEIDAMYNEMNKSISKAKRKIWVTLGICLGVLVLIYALIFGWLMLTGVFSNDKSKSNNKNIENISSIENNNNTNVNKDVDKTRTESKASVSLADNIVVNNNEYIEIKEVGYTTSNSYLTCIVTILNNSKKAIEYPSFRVTAYNREGKILGSEERVLSLIYPNHSMVDEGTLIKISEEPDKIEITMLKPEDYKIKDVNTLEHPQYNEMKCQNITVNSDKITGEVYNPNDYKMEQAKITIVFRDENNKIINSECAFVNNIPANGKAPFDISLPYDAKVTDKIEATACIW